MAEEQEAEKVLLAGEDRKEQEYSTLYIVFRNLQFTLITSQS